MKVRQAGFTLVEVLVTIGIVGVLAAIAYPSYEHYVRKSRYSELVSVAAPYKSAIATCYNVTKSLNSCFANNNGVPNNVLNNSNGLMRYVITIPNGVIFVFPNDRFGFTLLGDYYALIPTVTNGVLTWNYSGPGVTKGYVSNP